MLSFQSLNYDEQSPPVGRALIGVCLMVVAHDRNLLYMYCRSTRVVFIQQCQKILYTPDMNIII